MEEIAQRTLIIYNLLSDYNENDLKEFFQKTGDIEEIIKFDNIKNYPFEQLEEYQNCSFAMIVFTDKDNLESAKILEEFNDVKLLFHQPTVKEIEILKAPKIEKIQEQKEEKKEEFIPQQPEIIQEKPKPIPEEKKEQKKEKINVPVAKPQNYELELIQKLQNINVPAFKPLKKNDYFQHVIKSNYLLCNFMIWFVLWWTILK